MPLTLEGGTAMVVYKTADESNSTVTLADVADMVFDVDAGQEYEFEFVVAFQSAGTGTGIGLAVSCPAAPAFIAYLCWVYGTTAMQAGTGSVSDAAFVSTGVQAANTPYVAIVRGILKNGPNAGQLKLRFKSEVAASAITILGGTIGKLYPQPT